MLLFTNCDKLFFCLYKWLLLYHHHVFFTLALPFATMYLLTENVEEDQLAHTCRLMLLCFLRCSITNCCHLNSTQWHLALSLLNKLIVVFHWLIKALPLQGEETVIIYRKNVESVDQRSACTFCAV